MAAGVSSQSAGESQARRAWLLLLPGGALYAFVFFIPLALLIASSFMSGQAGSEAGTLSALTGENYRDFFRDGVTFSIFLSTVRLAAIVTITCVLLSYPLALAMRSASLRTKLVMILVVVSPLLTSVIVRNVAWLLVLGREGLINAALRAAGLIDAPLPLLYNTFGVVVGVTHVYLSFVALPLFASLTTIDPAVEEAASALGASPLQVFLRVTLPLSLPGAIAGATLAFIMCMGVYLTPVIMGGSFVATLPMVITDLVRNQYEGSRAAAFAVILLLVICLALALLQLVERRLLGWRR